MFLIFIFLFKFQTEQLDLFIYQPMRWTCYQTGKTNSAFSNPHRYVHVCCNFITKNAPSLFLQAIPLCIPYQSLPVNFHFLFSLISLNSKKPPQLPPIRHSNHILFLHLYTLFLLFETKTHKTHFHFLHFWSQRLHCSQQNEDLHMGFSCPHRLWSCLQD